MHAPSSASTPTSTQDSALRTEISRQAVLIGLILLFAMGVFTTTAAIGQPERFRPFAYAPMLNLGAMIFAIIALAVRTLELALKHREKHPIARLWQDMRGHVLEPRILIMLATPFLVLPVLIGSYSSMKTLIPILNPFHLDAALYGLDQWLHFGIDPWRLTHRLFGGETATQFINLVYNSWFGIMWVAILFYTTKTDLPRHRMRFLLSFVLLWIGLGSLAALALSSAGPCYFGRVTGLVDPYAPLMSRLYEIDAALGGQDGGGLGLLALRAQEMLWQTQLDGIGRIGNGISAMPSMHVAVATLLALTAWRHSRAWGWAMTAYALLIMIGSVHLGWHYAVDGYVSIIAALLVWRLAGWLVDRSEASRLG